MLKTIRDMFLGALIPALVGFALAVTGTPPGTGFQLVDGAWLNGVSGGVNASFASGITCTGATQTTATPLPTQITLIEVDTGAASTGCNLPSAFAGTEISVYNNTVNSIIIYPAVANNPVTGVQDTINNTTSVTLTTRTSGYFYSAKTGIWAKQ